MLVGGGNEELFEVGNSDTGVDVVGEELGVHHQTSLGDGGAHQCEGSTDARVQLGGKEPVLGQDPVHGVRAEEPESVAQQHTNGSGDVADVGSIRLPGVPRGAGPDEAEVTRAVVAQHDHLARPQRSHTIEGDHAVNAAWNAFQEWHHPRPITMRGDQFDDGVDVTLVANPTSESTPPCAPSRESPAHTVPDPRSNRPAAAVRSSRLAATIS